MIKKNTLLSVLLTMCDKNEIQMFVFLQLSCSESENTHKSLWSHINLYNLVQKHLSNTIEKIIYFYIAVYNNNKVLY